MPSALKASKAQLEMQSGPYKGHCKWVENDFDGMIPGLKANKFDGVISSMTVTPAAVVLALVIATFDVP